MASQSKSTVLESKKNEERAQVSLRLNLSLELFRAFESRAQSLGLEIEEVLARHLAATQTQDQEKGRSIKLSPEQRQSIEVAFNRPFRDGNELAHFLLQVFSVQLGPELFSLQLSPDLLRRIDGRRGRMELKAFLTETIIRQLEHFTGMR